MAKKSFGSIPGSITTTETEICRSDAASCAGLVDLGVLTANEEYIVSIPVDPRGGSGNGTGYTIYRSSNDRITVNAPSSEYGKEIRVTR